MIPSELKDDQFAPYPAAARQLAVAHLALLKQLPASFVPLLLREIISYDWKFPAEQKAVQQELGYLESLSTEQRDKAMAGFARLSLSSELEKFDGVNFPVQFSEKLTAHLWATGQIDAFRKAALDYGRQVDAARTPDVLPAPRLCIAIIGQGVAASKYRLFRKLRKEGVYFTGVKPENGVQVILEAVAARAKAHPVPFGHWYIEGGALEPVLCPELTSVSYQALAPQRAALLKRMEKVIQSGTGGPEALRTLMAQLSPEEVGFSGAADDAVLNHFQVSVLTEGSGTQVFSTTFVQWTAREALRRAQPITLVARFAPRQRDRTLNELIASPRKGPEFDPEGSLLDADMGAYLTWINQQRLAGAEHAAFLAWWESQSQAVAIGPGLPGGATSNDPIDIRQLLSQVTS